VTPLAKVAFAALGIVIAVLALLFRRVRSAAEAERADEILRAEYDDIGE
jgi:hypothetical protein